MYRFLANRLNYTPRKPLQYIEYSSAQVRFVHGYVYAQTWLKSEIQTNSVAREGQGSRTYGVRVANEGTG